MMLWAISGRGRLNFDGWGGCIAATCPGPAGGSGVNFRAGTVIGHHHMGAAVNCSCTWTCPHLKLLSVVLKHGLKGNEIIKPINLLALLLSSVPLFMGELFHP